MNNLTGVGYGDSHFKPCKDICNRIIGQINEFENALDNTQQAAVAVFSSTILIDSVTPSEPDMIVLSGHTLDNMPAKILCHISQLNIALIGQSRLDDLSQPRRKIGFIP